VLCKSSSGALGNPAPPNPTTLDSPIPNDGTRVPTPLSCNALCPICLVTPLKLRQKFCSKKCGTLSRVRRLRAKNAPLQKLKVPIANDHLQERRIAGAGLRDAGKYSVAMAARQRKETLKTLRTEFRAESKKRRDALKQQNKELTIELNRLIAEADAVYDKAVVETGIALVTPKKGSL
jgi:hypothetical protein